MTLIPRILKITFVYDQDDDPDLSYLGEYKNIVPSGTPDFAVIDRKDRGDQGRNEMRYFIGNHENYKGEAPVDAEGYVEDDYHLMERISRGDIPFIGIRAVADVVIAGIVQHLSSGGLWGISSDSDRSYLRSVEDEELKQLRSVLVEVRCIEALKWPEWPDLRKHPAFVETLT